MCRKITRLYYVCQKTSPVNEYDVNKNDLSEIFKCKLLHIVVKTRCYAILHETNPVNKGQLCKNMNSKPLKESKIDDFNHIFDVVLMEGTYMNIFMENDINFIFVVKIQKFFGLLSTTRHAIEKNIDGYHICNFEKIKMTVGLNMFHCKEGGYIPTYYICDGIGDCSNDDSDEEYCICKNTTLIKQDDLCQVIYLGQNVKICGNNYVMTIRGNCRQNTPFSISINNRNSNHHIRIKRSKEISPGQRVSLGSDNHWRIFPQKTKSACRSGLDFDRILSGNIIPDCGVDNDDAQLFEYISRTENNFSPCKPFQVLCSEENYMCFEIRDICIYKINIRNQLIPCQNGAHLKNCEKFTCNMMFKCENSYCIPWTYVCDGKWDCLEGQDESIDIMCSKPKVCKHMYKCKTISRYTKHICIHIGNVCDNEQNCPLNDDEMFCSLKEIKCHFSCRCLLFAISCIKIPSSTFENILFTFTFYSIFISDSEIENIKILKINVQLAYIIKLPRNSIKNICPFLQLLETVFIDLGFNLVKMLESECFTLAKKLVSLAINNNKISQIESGSFTNLINLTFLNLSHNPIHNLPTVTLSGLPYFKLFDINNISFSDISITCFTGIRRVFTITTDYYVCCVAPEEFYCTSHPSQYLCSDILPTETLKHTYKVISMLALLLNVLSIFTQLFTTHLKKTFSYIVIFINTCDLLCVIYLCCIWIADQWYQTRFLIRERSWNSHILCFASFGIILWFTMLSPALLTLLCVVRLLAVLSPIKNKSKILPYSIYLCNFLCICSFVASLGFTLIFKLTQNKIHHNLCLPFMDPAGSLSLIQFVTWFVVCLHSITSIAITLMHCLLYHKVKESRKVVEKSKSKDNSNTRLICQLVVSDTSYFLCWYPAVIIYILSIFLSSFPAEVFFWLVVVIIPINSITSPGIFLVMTMRKYYEQARRKNLRKK